jgi:hypothetical protein
VISGSSGFRVWVYILLILMMEEQGEQEDDSLRVIERRGVVFSTLLERAQTTLRKPAPQMSTC